MEWISVDKKYPESAALVLVVLSIRSTTGQLNCVGSEISDVRSYRSSCDQTCRLCWNSAGTQFDFFQPSCPFKRFEIYVGNASDLHIVQG
jgi:hypothetical protein